MDKLNRSNLMAVLLLVVGVLVVYFGIYKGIDLLFTSGKKLAQAQKELVDWQARQDLVRSLQNKIKDSNLAEELNLALPASEATAELLASVEAAAFQAKVNLENFAPNITESRTGISSYETDMNVRGSYEAVKDFITKLENLKRVSRLDTLSLSKDEAGNIVATIKLKVYYLTEEQNE